LTRAAVQQDSLTRSQDGLLPKKAVSKVESRPDAGGLVRVLALSLAAAAVPVAAVVFFPENLQHYEALTWLLLLVPAFLWAYERGWRGIATALALGMAALSLTYAVAELLGGTIPDLLLPVVVVYVAISLGIGVFGTRLSRARYHAATEELTLQDSLTGLPNRRHLELHLEMEYAAAERGRPLSVVLFDIDGLKEHNARHGRASGDGILRGFASLLRQQARRMDVAARYAADEFAAVLPSCSEEGAVLFAARVQERLRAADHSTALPTVSAGIASYGPELSTPQELLAAASAAMVQARQDGGDRVRIHGRGVAELGEPDSGAMQLAAAESLASEGSGRLDFRRFELPSYSAPLLGQGRAAFVLTDDAVVREALTENLRQQGFHVAVGSALPDTILPLQHDYDFVFVDIGPHVAAADLVREIRLRSPTTRIIGIMRPAGDKVPAELLKTRVDGHYVPGTDDEALQQQMRELLGERDALTNVQLRHRQITNELRSRDREVRRALEISEARFRAVLQSVQEVILSTDAEGRLTFLNPAWTAITGFSVDESLGQPLFLYLHAPDDVEVREQFRRLVDNRTAAFSHEGRWRTQSGAERLLEMHMQWSAGVDGVEGATGVLADVTDRRNAEAALRRSEQYYRALIEYSEEVVAVLNADLTIRYISPPVERLCGWAADRWIGESVLHRVHPDDAAAAQATLAQVLDEPGAKARQEVRLRCASGDWVRVETWSRNLLLTPGVEGVVVHARGVAERPAAGRTLAAPLGDS
jgi:diguanylate cyclase (GGDEF)-like protein/PAS domain S-box-containing protein